MKDDMTPEIEKALSQLIRKAPAYASLALGLKVAATEQVPWMATDGIRLFYHPKNILTWTEDELQAVICHEVEHCARLHMLRRGARDKLIWNFACDFVINESVKASGFTLPKGCLFDPKLNGLAEEEIYRQLEDEAQKHIKEIKDKGGIGDVIDAPEGMTQGEKERLQEKWESATRQAASLGKEYGNCPAWMSKMLDDFLNPKENWKQILSQFLTSRIKNDYSWTRPNRRYGHTGFILPALDGTGLGTVVLVSDTSGSTWDWQSRFFDHVQSILLTCNPERVIYMECDADVENYQELQAGDTIKREAHGGGGTSFKPPFRRLEQEGITPECLIYLTDLYGDFPEHDPGYPVLWASTSDEKVPFGDKLRLQE